MYMVVFSFSTGQPQWPNRFFSGYVRSLTKLLNSFCRLVDIRVRDWCHSSSVSVFSLLLVCVVARLCYVHIYYAVESISPAMTAHHHLPRDEKSGITATGKAAPPPRPTTSKAAGDDGSSRKRRRRRRPMIGPAVWAQFKEEQRVSRSQFENRKYAVALWLFLCVSRHCHQLNSTWLLFSTAYAAVAGMYVCLFPYPFARSHEA